MTDDTTTETVRQRYAQLATTAAHGDTCCTPDEQAVFGTSRYDTDDINALPAAAAAASLGCGNPTAVAELRRRRRPCSTSAPAAASTSCSRPAASARPARPTAST